MKVTFSSKGPSLLPTTYPVPNEYDVKSSKQGMSEISYLLPNAFKETDGIPPFLPQLNSSHMRSLLRKLLVCSCCLFFGFPSAKELLLLLLCSVLYTQLNAAAATLREDCVAAD